MVSVVLDWLPVTPNASVEVICAAADVNDDVVVINVRVPSSHRQPSHYHTDILSSFNGSWPRNEVKRGICYERVCPSVRPSHSRVTLKWFQISKYVLHMGFRFVPK